MGRKTEGEEVTQTVTQQAIPVPAMEPQQQTVPAGPIHREVVTKDRMLVTPTNGTHASKTPGFSRLTGQFSNPPARSCKEYIDKISNGELEGSVAAVRVVPFPQTELTNLRGNYESIVTALSDFGFGTWELRILNGDGQRVFGPVGAEKVMFDEEIYGPSKTPQIINGQPMVVAPKKKKAVESDGDGEDRISVLRRKKLEEQEKFELEELQRDQQKKREKANDSSSAIVEALRDEIRDLKAQINRPQSGPNVKEIIELMIALNGNSRKGDDIGTVLQTIVGVINSSNEKVFQAILKMNESKPDKTDKLTEKVLDALVDQKINGGSNQFELAEKIRRQTRQETEEMFERFAQTQEGDGFDPNAGLGNVWVLLGKVFSSLKEGAPALLAAMQQGAAPKSPAELQQLSQHLQGMQLPLPPSGNLQPVIQPMPNPPAELPGQELPPIAIPETQPQQMGQPVQSSPASTPAQAEGDLTLEQRIDLDLRDEVEESVQEMLVDFSVGRAEHRWILNAVRYWHPPFLKQLCEAPDHDARIAMIREKCAKPETVAQLDLKLNDANSGNKYNFFLALNTLIESFKQLVDEAAKRAQQVPVTTPAKA